MATERLEQYADQVREIQAMDAIPVKPTACPLREFFEEQEDEYTVLAQRHQLQFSMDISGVPDIQVQVMLDGTLVHRMIDNVISNALRFAHHEIALKAGWQEGVLTIQVYDDGAGFSEESLRSATRPFYKENTENDHFGLGLSICNTLCQKQGGTLSLSNRRGACVEMQIQAEKINAD